MTVLPPQHIAHKAITRPRMSGREVNCRVAFALALKAMLANPTRERAASASTNDGAKAAKIIVAPQATAVRDSVKVLDAERRPATISPPTMEPIDIAMTKAL